MMVLSTFNPLYAAAAAAVMYQQREQHSSMQSYYQHEPAYGNASNGQDAFYPMNLYPNTQYGYGQQMTAFTPPPNPHPFKYEQFPAQSNIPTSDTGHRSAEIVPEAGMANLSGGSKECSPTGTPYSTVGQQSMPSQPPDISYPPCQVYANPKMESVHRISPNYYAPQSSGAGASSYYSVTPPTTGLQFMPNMNSMQQFHENLHPEYPWMKRTFQAQLPTMPVSASSVDIGWCPNNAGRTRTREKYRMVYSDGQRLELEKEFITNEYIGAQRKTYLSQMLGLSERQIKIWFQNRRAKKRKQTRKVHAPAESASSVGQSVSSTSDFRTIPSLASISATSDEGEMTRNHSLDDISPSPDPFL